MNKWRYYGVQTKVPYKATSREISEALRACRKHIEGQIANAPWGEPAEKQFEEHVPALADPNSDFRTVIVTCFARYEYLKEVFTPKIV